MNHNYQDKQQSNYTSKQEKKFSSFHSKLKSSGWKLIVTAIIGIALFGTTAKVSVTEANNLLKQGYSNQISVSTVLLTKDSIMQAKDYTISHSSELETTNIWIWDYAAEDGDYVQILVDGTPICDAFMIKNKAKKFSVPATGEIKVLGIRDGGGGITYAIHYEINGTTYFNGTDIGNSNIYTLIREKR